MKNLSHRLQNRIHVSRYSILLICFLVTGASFESCTDKCDVTHQYVYYKPVYTLLDEVRESVEVISSQPIKTAGKIYFKDGWLFVNEPGEGVHIIDNHDPANPQFESFVKVPGNYDLAIKGNTLYVDSYIDLVALDITDLNNITEVTRVKNIFTNYNSLGFYATSESIVTSWEEVKQVEVYESECDAQIQPWGGILFNDGIAVLENADFSVRAAIAPGNGSVSGVGGSMARFTVQNDYLYIVDGGDIQPFNISAETQPLAKDRINIGWGLETIFPYGNNLFIGSRTGMHIIDITEPSDPNLLSTYDHVRVCDPVVVQDDLAFVTLRSGTECEGFTNQLEVINIENLLQPELLEVYPMTNPHGLGVDGNTLFVCDGADGLKVFDKSDISKIDQNRIAHYANIDAYDVIPFNNILMMIGNDGIFQYDYANPKAIKLLSHIPIVNENN